MTPLEQRKVTELKSIAKEIMSEYCGSYSTLRKDELIKFISKLDKSSHQEHLQGKKVSELKKLAKAKKEEFCKPPYSKMKKQNMIRMIERYNIENNLGYISHDISAIVSSFFKKKHSRSDPLSKSDKKQKKKHSRSNSLSKSGKKQKVTGG